MMKYFISCLLAVFLFPNIIASQETGNLSGTVRTDNGEEALGATVLLQDTDYATITDTSGNFIFEGLQPGTYTLKVSMVGYQTTLQDVQIGTGTETTVLIVLTTDITQLQTVEVTGRKNIGYKADYSFAATKVAIPVTEIPSTVSTITQQLIRDRQAVRFQDIARNTNVRVTNNGRSVIIRGFESSNRLINGLRTLADNYRFSAISPVVESYEVIKGPSSSMFGNMSPGGVVNLITKKPLATKKQQVSLSTGSFNTVRGDLDFTGKVTEDGTVLYRLNMFGQLSDTWYQNMKDDALTIAPSFSFLPTDGTRINVDVNHTMLTTMENDGLFPFPGQSIDQTPIDFTVLQIGDANKTTTTSLNFSLSQKITDNINFNVSYLKDFLTWDDARHAAEIYLGDSAWTEDGNVSVYYAEWEAKMDADNVTGYLSADFKTGKITHKALLGYDYNVSLFNWGTYRFAESVGSVNVYDPALSSPGLDGDSYELSANTYGRVNKTRDFANGVYFQDQVGLSDRFKVLLGLRNEKYTYRLAYETPNETELSQTAWLPKVGVTFELPSHTYLYGSYITGFQPVASATLQYGSVEGGGDLDPEYSDQFEFGAKQELFGKNLLLTAALYQIRKTNVTQLTNPGAPIEERIYRQLGEVSSKGVEFEINGRVNRSLSINLAYNYNNAEVTEDIDESNIGSHLGLAPEHQGNLWAKYEWLDKGPLNGLGIGLGASVSSETPMLNTPDITTPGYGVIDGALSYRVGHISLNLNFNNIFDKRYYTGALNVNQRYYVGAPRNMMLRIGYAL